MVHRDLRRTFLRDLNALDLNAPTGTDLRTERIHLSRITSALCALFFFTPSLAVAWGNEGHTYINEVAAAKIPASMPQFLRQAAREIAYLGLEPDRWRSPSEFALKNAQEPDHFINLERVDWMKPLPPGRYQFYLKLYEKRAAAKDSADDYLPERVGLQPYVTIEVFDRLKSAFRDYRQLRETHRPTTAVEKAIIFYAGWLGHYVADGCQPLHTTIQYNGWVGPNPNHYPTEHTIHSQFESTYVAANIHPADFSSMVHEPTHLSDPFKEYVAYLYASHDQVEKVYELDKAGAFTGTGTPEARAFTAQRMAAGSQMLLNLWYAAWLDSAIPVQMAPAEKPAVASK